MSIKIAASCFALCLYISTCESNPCSNELGNNNDPFAQVYDDIIYNNCNVCIGKPYPKELGGNKYNPCENNESEYEAQDCYTEYTKEDEECEPADDNEPDDEGTYEPTCEDDNESEKNVIYKPKSKYEYEPNNDDDDDEDEYKPKYDDDDDDDDDDVDDDDDDDNDCKECDFD